MLTVLNKISNKNKKACKLNQLLYSHTAAADLVVGFPNFFFYPRPSEFTITGKPSLNLFLKLVQLRGNHVYFLQIG